MRIFQHTNTQQNKAIIQPSLEIGKEDDEHEKEANHVADKVMKMPDPSASIQKMHGKEEEKEKMMEGGKKVQMMVDSPLKISKMTNYPDSGLTASPNVEQGINSSKGKGQSLDIGLQNELGNKMGADFSDVKLHTGENAVQMNKEIGAKAFTHGNDIYFNSGQYNPATNTGKHLLAHELTHTVQQATKQSLIQREQIIPDKKQAHFNMSLRSTDNYPAIVVESSTTINKIASQTISIFNDIIVDKGNPPPKLTEDELAKAMIADRSAFLLNPSFQDNFKTGLLFPLPAQINPITNEWTVNPNYIKARAGEFKTDWQDYLETMPAEGMVTDFATMAANLIAGNKTNSELAIVLQLKIRKNPDEAYPLINEVFKLKGDGKYDLAVSISQLITKKDQDIFAMTRSGFAISQLLLQALGKQNVKDLDQQKEAVNRIGISEMNLAKGRTVIVTQQDWDNANNGDQFTLWGNYANKYSLLSEDLGKFNIDPSTGVTKVLSVGSDIYIPSPDELLFEEFVAKYKDRRIAAQKFAEYTLTPDYAVAKAGIELTGNEMVGPSYATTESVFYSPNPNLGGAKVVESTKGSNMVLYSVNWGPTWKCNIFVHDAVYRAGYQPTLNSVNHYLRPGEMSNNSSVDPASDKNYLKVKIKEAVPGSILAFPGTGAAGHNAILASFIISTDKDGNEKADGDWIKFKVMEAGAQGADKEEKFMQVYPRSDEYTYYTSWYAVMNAYQPLKKRE